MQTLVWMFYISVFSVTLLKLPIASDLLSGAHTNGSDSDVTVDRYFLSVCFAPYFSLSNTCRGPSSRESCCCCRFLRLVVNSFFQNIISMFSQQHTLLASCDWLQTIFRLDFTTILSDRSSARWRKKMNLFRSLISEVSWIWPVARGSIWILCSGQCKQIIRLTLFAWLISINTHCACPWDICVTCHASYCVFFPSISSAGQNLWLF